MIGQVTPVALAAVGWRYYLLFVICDITNALFFYFFLPETKALSLEAMDDLFANSPWIVPGSHWQAPLAVDPDALADNKMAMEHTEDVDDRSYPTVAHSRV